MGIIREVAGIVAMYNPMRGYAESTLVLLLLPVLLLLCTLIFWPWCCWMEGILGASDRYCYGSKGYF